MEAKRVLAGKFGRCRPDEAFSHERHQVSADRRELALRRERCDRTSPELAPDDRRSLEHCTLVGVETVEAACEQRFDRRRNGCEVVILARLLDPGDELLGEQRVALGELDDAAALVFVDGVAGEVGDERSGVVAVERTESQRRDAGLRVGPRRPFIEQVRACDREQKNRCIVRPRSEVLDEVEEGRLGPVDVVEDHHERALAREGLERAPHGPGGVACGRGHLATADECGDATHDVFLERLLELGQHVS